MRTISRNPLPRTVVLLLAGVMLGVVSSARAQQDPSGNLPTATATSLTFQASNSRSTVMSFERVRAITQGSLREAIGLQLANITPSEIGDKLRGGYDVLKQGATIGFNAPVAALAGRSITEQHLMQVKVGYEPRPIGGILTIKVEIVPLFSGIGSASRPIAFREISEAIDNLDEDGLGELVAGLTHQLGAEYAVK